MFGISEALRLDNSVPCGFKILIGLSLYLWFIDGEQIELFIISLNPIPTRFWLIIVSITLILFFPISGIVIEILFSILILSNPYTLSISSITSISL